MIRLAALLACLLAAGAKAQVWSPVASGTMPNCTNGALNYNSATLEFSCAAPSSPSFPAGMVSAFNGDCPSTWTEIVAARGRVVVGLPSGGTLAGTVGTALTDLQNKTHSHTYTDVVNHTHPVVDPGHTHLTQRYPTATGASSGFTIDTSMSGTLANNTLPTASATTGVTTSNPAGGVATGTTATASTSDVISYIQFRLCQKD